MATYAIGDVQGCFAALQLLLSHIQFDYQHDKLWFTGDLVNRGPDSLAVLQCLYQMENQPIIVLGNHDLHLIARYYGARAAMPLDTIDNIVRDHGELIEWLRFKPLLHYDAKLQYVMTHAGIAPLWSLAEAMEYASVVEQQLQSDNCADFLRQMFGDQPALWQQELRGYERLRCIVNYLTRMRYCYADGSLDFAYKGRIESKPEALTPWFAVPNRIEIAPTIIFGHWAALNGEVAQNNLYALDTGCVWGNSLTALCLETRKLYSVPCAL